MTPDELCAAMNAVIVHLGPPVGRRYWCGPAAVAWAARVPYREAYGAAVALTERPVVRWMRWSEVLRLALHFGLPAGKPCGDTGRLPRRRALRTLAAEHAQGEALVRVGGHFCLLRDGAVLDQWRTGTDPASLRWMVTHFQPIGEQHEPR